MSLKEEIITNLKEGFHRYRIIIWYIEQSTINHELVDMTNKAIDCFRYVHGATQNQMPQTDFDEKLRYYWFDISVAMIDSLKIIKKLFTSH